jgi:GxxExxY protein
MDTIYRMVDDELTGAIIKASFEVSNELGAGFLESVYEKALMVALAQMKLTVTAQVGLKVKFRDVVVGDFYADLIVEDKVLVELKAISKVLPQHKAQVINYLNATGLETGLLLNFGNPRVEYFRLHKRENPEHPVNPV